MPATSSCPLIDVAGFYPAPRLDCITIFRWGGSYIGITLVSVLCLQSYSVLCVFVF